MTGSHRSFESSAYRGLRLWNDWKAVRRGRIARRLLRRAYGKATGRLARRLLG